VLKKEFFLRIYNMPVIRKNTVCLFHLLQANREANVEHSVPAARISFKAFKVPFLCLNFWLVLLVVIVIVVVFAILDGTGRI